MSIFAKVAPSLDDRAAASSRLAADALGAFRFAADGLTAAADEAADVALDAFDEAALLTRTANTAADAATTYRRQASRIEALLGDGDEVPA